MMIENLPIGILSTLAMTLFTESVFAIIKRPYHVVRILGNMLLFNRATNLRSVPPRSMVLIANFIHYAIGIIFTFGFHGLVTGKAESLLIGSLFYGVLIGVVAVIGWRLFFHIHPGPPPVELHVYLLVIALGHVVLSLTIYGMINICDGRAV